MSPQPVSTSWIGSPCGGPLARLEGKVAFITGIGRGQGRSHALRLASEGADIIGVDICADFASVAYPMSTEADLAETVRQVEALDRRIVARVADARDRAALQAVVDEGVAQLGRLDFVVANAGISPGLFRLTTPEEDQQAWDDGIGVNLTGVWNTTQVAIPHIVAGGRGGAIVLTGSTAGLRGMGGGATAWPSTASSASCAAWPTTWPTRTSASTSSTRPR